jgi:hypothetical protein
MSSMSYRLNPFPGMNPFMEQTWPDLYLRLIAALLDSLGTQLPDDLVAKGEQRVDVLGGSSASYRPDVSVIEDSWKTGLPPVWTTVSGAAAVTEPELLQAEEPPERWVEIHAEDGQLVTVVEVLSPVNKISQRKDYRAKRADLLSAGVNVVEIDLLRQGQRIVNVDSTDYDRRYHALGEHYVICTTRAAKPARREVYVSPLRQRLPAIRLPLRSADMDVPLDLQALIDHAYVSGRYWKLDYRIAALAPTLSQKDAEWVGSRLTEAGLC